MRYSVQPRDWIFIKGYGFLSFAKNMDRNTGKNINKNLSGKKLKYSQKLLDHAKQSATDAFKTASKRAVQKSAKATGDLIGNKTANEIVKIWKNSQQNNSETVTNKHNKEIHKRKIYISRRKRRNYGWTEIKIV